MELFEIDRKKSAYINLVLIILLSLPCALGPNLLSGFQPMGEGSVVLDLEDFIVSNLLLPIGSLIYLVFCTNRYGWGFEKYREEANQGTGIRVAPWMKWYVTLVLPVMILVLLLQGLL